MITSISVSDSMKILPARMRMQMSIRETDIRILKCSCLEPAWLAMESERWERITLISSELMKIFRNNWRNKSIVVGRLLLPRVIIKSRILAICLVLNQSKFRYRSLMGILNGLSPLELLTYRRINCMAYINFYVEFSTGLYLLSLCSRINLKLSIMLKISYFKWTMIDFWLIYIII